MEPQSEISLPASAQLNMDSDYARLMSLTAHSSPFLRFYQWEKPSFTYGYFTVPDKWLELEKLEEAGFDSGRRPTGGGVLFHTHDLAFSLLIPQGHPLLSENTLANYHLVNSLVQTSLKNKYALDSTLLKPQQGSSSFCMAEPTVYDVMIGNKKVGGAAQRRTKTGLLHQGTLCLTLPIFSAWEPFFKDKSLLEKMEASSYPLNQSYLELSTSLKEAFVEAFQVL